jgi:uncharacterized membrane protein YdbT with pleckstrin-like domain
MSARNKLSSGGRDRLARHIIAMENFGAYLFCWLIVPIFFALVYYLHTRCKVFELTTQRLKITSGVFTKVTETLELYRVKDIETTISRSHRRPVKKLEVLIQ